MRSGGKGLAALRVKLRAEPMMLVVTLFTAVQSDSSLPEETVLELLLLPCETQGWHVSKHLPGGNSRALHVPVQVVPFPTVGRTPMAYWQILLLSGFVLHLKYTCARICLNKVFAVLTLPPCSCQESCKTVLIQCFMCSLAKE